MKSILPSRDRPGTVAIPHRQTRDGITEVLSSELQALGYQSVHFQIGSPIPEKAEVVFSYGPYGKFLTVPRQLAQMPREKKPIFVHWNTEGIPDLRIPWALMKSLSGWRSWMERIQSSPNGSGRIPGTDWLYSLVESRMLRFRYLGDYYYAHRRGWLDIFADTSAIYAEFHRQHGLPTIFAPWGSTPQWYNDLGLKRDIDVLWMGTRGTRRRGILLDRVRSELEAHGIRMHIADDIENPFIFGNERVHYLNRAKITLNLTRTWYDDNFSRIALAAPNRSLIVSETILPHCPNFLAGVHFVSAPVKKLAETILYYLHHEEERLRIVENAYHLVTTKLVFRESIKSIMDAVNQVYQSIPSIDHHSIQNVYKVPG